MSKAEQTYSIKDFEDISGIKTHTLRAWERRYNIFTPARTDTNIRMYSDGDLKKLLNIIVLQKYGMKISQLASMPEEELNSKVRSLVSLSDYDSIIDSLTVDMIDFNQNDFEKKLNKVIFDLGFEEAVYKVIYPFFKKVGVLWQTSSINPAQEHFVSGIIIQKFFLAIDSLDSPASNSKTFLLFLPSGELHELGLLLAHYLIRKAGHKVIYLGQSISMIDVIKTWKAANADYLFTHLTSMIDQEDITQYFTDLSDGLNQTPVWVSGAQISPDIQNLLKNITFLSSPTDLKESLKKS